MYIIRLELHRRILIVKQLLIELEEEFVQYDKKKVCLRGIWEKKLG